MLMSLQEARELQIKALKDEISPEEVKKIAVQFVCALEQNFHLQLKAEVFEDLRGCPTCGGYH